MKQNNKYSKRLRELRKASGMTIKELSKLIGISYQTLARYETGSTIPVDVYGKIVEKCKQRIDYNHKKYLG